jgi:hypothetical protein
LIEHDLFGKPLHTFPDHALETIDAVSAWTRLERMTMNVIDLALVVGTHLMSRP